MKAVQIKHLSPRTVTLLVLTSLLWSSVALSAARSKKAFKLESELMAQRPAVAAALIGVEATPEDLDSWRLLGRSLADAGAYADAVRAYERAVRLDDAIPDLWVDLGAARLRLGDHGAASTAFKRALKLEPFHALAHYNLGLAYQAADHYEAALDSLERALLLDPQLGDPRHNANAVNNELLPIVKHRVYLKTTGSNPALFVEDVGDPSTP
jgi:tetratricopeptide (TPR) repeat protein